jgi:hypothetical protein
MGVELRILDFEGRVLQNFMSDAPGDVLDCIFGSCMSCQYHLATLLIPCPEPEDARFHMILCCSRGFMLFGRMSGSHSALSLLGTLTDAIHVPRVPPRTQRATGD